jgi:anti-sigma regulatory factor (Ser/Thr protein kinase)
LTGAVCGARAAGHTHTIASLDISLPATPAAPRDARAAIATWLAGHAARGSLIDDARLLASELVSNSVRHAGIADGAAIRFSAALRPATLRLEVTDTGTEGAVARRSPRVQDGSGGFGLELVAELSRAWGIERDTGGTTVWLELDALESDAAREG